MKHGFAVRFNPISLIKINFQQKISKKKKEIKVTENGYNKTGFEYIILSLLRILVGMLHRAMSHV